MRVADVVPAELHALMAEGIAGAAAKLICEPDRKDTAEEWLRVSWWCGFVLDDHLTAPDIQRLVIAMATSAKPMEPGAAAKNVLQMRAVLDAGGYSPAQLVDVVEAVLASVPVVGDLGTVRLSDGSVVLTEIKRDGPAR